MENKQNNPPSRATVATIIVRPTQQPTGPTERGQFERMRGRRAGEEGGNNTAITGGENDAGLLLLCFVII